jgi:hypothetical protein
MTTAGVLDTISLTACPELYRLLLEGETLDDLNKLSHEELLLRWFNFHLGPGPLTLKGCILIVADSVELFCISDGSRCWLGTACQQFFYGSRRFRVLYNLARSGLAWQVPPNTNVAGCWRYVPALPRF